MIKIPGLSSDSTTTVTIAGNQTKLPVYYNSSGVGVIVLPVVVGGVVLAGIGVTGPKPPLPIFLDEEGRPILSESEQEEVGNDADDKEEEEDDDPEPPDTNSFMSASSSSLSTSAFTFYSSRSSQSSPTEMTASSASMQIPSSTMSMNFSSTVASANSSMSTATENASMEDVTIIEPMGYWIVPTDEGYDIASLIDASINADPSNRLQNSCSRTASTNSTFPYTVRTYNSSQTSSSTGALIGTGGMQLVGAGNIYGMQGPSATPTSSSATVTSTPKTTSSSSSVPTGVLVPCGENARPPKTRCPDWCPFKEVGLVDPGDGGPLVNQGFCDNSANLPR